MDAPDVDLDGTAQPFAPEHDIEDALVGQERLESLEVGTVRTEVDDVVEGQGWQAPRLRDDVRSEARRLGDRAEHGGLGGILDDDGQGRRDGRLQQRVQAVDDMAGFDHDQQRSAGLQGVALGRGVGALDAGPRFQERHGRRTGLLRHRDEEALPGAGLDDHALVHDHVFLQPAFEVVAEGGIGLVGHEGAVVGLDEDAFTDAMSPDLAADGDDAGTGLVARDRGLLAGHVVGHLGQDGLVDAGDDGTLAWMARPGVQELRITEADPDRLDPRQHLRGAHRADRLGAVEADLVGANELDGVLGLRDPCHDSITWPPVTGRAWPVSYCCATR